MEDDGITFERESIDAAGTLVGLKYLRCAILENMHDSATGCEDIYFKGETKICENLKKFSHKNF